MQKISRTWGLMGACWQILKKDKEMLVFPLVSGICCLLVMVGNFSFGLLFFLLGLPGIALIVLGF